MQGIIKKLFAAAAANICKVSSQFRVDGGGGGGDYVKSILKEMIGRIIFFIMFMIVLYIAIIKLILFLDICCGR